MYNFPRSSSATVQVEIVDTELNRHGIEMPIAFLRVFLFRVKKSFCSLGNNESSWMLLVFGGFVALGCNDYLFRREFLSLCTLSITTD